MIFASLYPDKEENNIAFALSLPFHPRTPVSEVIGTNHFLPIMIHARKD
jgi:hypothetical protein